VSGLGEFAWVGHLLKVANPVKWSRGLSSWFRKQVMLRRPIAAEVTGEFYQGVHPYKDGLEVTALICQVTVRNPSDIANTVASVHLEAAGRAPMYPSEHRRTDQGRDILVPRGGGFASVPTKDRWLQLPARLGPWGAEMGWVGFAFTEPGDMLTFGEARGWTVELVLTPVRGDRVRATVPARSLPDLSPANESSA
jgi:hypothetical protein